ncbi:MAG: hypothetical protein KAS75_06465, partial [Planctomycetes bacterium]|nr:hypothetical protein [Planctomycetota bacterium]
MTAARIKLIHLWDKAARYIPLMDTAKQSVCLIRWANYKRKIKKYKNLANEPTIEPKILVLMDSGIGNSIEATPLAQAIRDSWPKAEITIRVASTGLFDNWSAVNHIAAGPEQLRGQRFTHTFVPWGGRISLNKGHCSLGQVHYTEEGLNRRCTKPEREYNMDMLSRLGYDSRTPDLYVSTQKPKETIASSDLRICLVPGGTTTHKWRYKHWPYFEQLGNILLQKHPNAQICIIGTENDHIPKALLTSDRVIDLRGKLSLEETAWVLQNSNLAIGNDCGPMHIAD